MRVHEAFVLGIITAVVFGAFTKEKEVVEVLPKNYEIITDISRSTCAGPMDTTLTGRVVRTQRVSLSGN